MACDVNIGMCADGTKARSEINKTQSSAKGFGKSASKSFGNIAKAAGIAGGAMLALTKTIKFVKGSIKSVSDFEIAVAKLDNVIRATAGAAGLTTAEMLKMADELQILTTVSNTAAIEAQGVLATFKNIGREVFPEALMAAADMSEMFGQDLRQSVVQLGKALNDPITGLTALRRIGITFSEQQTEMIKALQNSGDLLGAQAILLKELQTEFGGAAAAARNTFGGAIKALGNNVGDLQRNVGLLITQEGGLRDLIDIMNEFFEVPKNMRNIVRAFQILGATAVVAFKSTIFAIKLSLDSVRLLWEAVRDLGNIFVIALDPKNWKPGRMKAALKELQFGTVEVITTIKNDVITLAEGIGEAFAGAIDPNLPELVFEPVKQGIIGVTNALNENKLAVENLVITYQAGYFPTMQSMSDMTTMFTKTTKLNTRALSKQEVHVDSLNQRLMDLELTQDRINNIMADELTLTMTNFAGALGDAAIAGKGFGKALKVLVRDTFANLLVAIGEQLIAMSVLYLILGQFGKAAAAFAGGTAAVIAGHVVKSFQQGGLVSGSGLGDTVPAFLEPGEVVLSKETVSRNQGLITSMQGGMADQQPLQIFIGDRLIFDNINEGIQNNEILITRENIKS